MLKGRVTELVEKLWLEGSNCGLPHENDPELPLKSGTEPTKDSNVSRVSFCCFCERKKFQLFLEKTANLISSAEISLRFRVPTHIWKGSVEQLVDFQVIKS